MLFPTKGLKAINHRDTHYRWIVRNRGGKNNPLFPALRSGRRLFQGPPAERNF